MMMLALPWRHAVIFLFSPRCSPAAWSTFARFSAVCCSGTRSTLQKFPFVHQSVRWWSQTRLLWVSPLNLRTDFKRHHYQASVLIAVVTCLIIWQFLLFRKIHCWSRVHGFMDKQLWGHFYLCTSKRKKMNTFGRRAGCYVCWVADFLCGISPCSIFLMATAASM